VQKDTAYAFGKLAGRRIDVIGCNNKRGFENLAKGKCDVLIRSPERGIAERDAILQRFPEDGPQPEQFRVGQFVVYVVVNKRNAAVGRLTYAQLRSVFSGSVTDWKELGGTPGRIVLVGERIQSKSREIVQNEILGDATFSASISVLPDYMAVVGQVAKEPKAIGYCLYRDQPVENVKVLAVGRDEKEPSFLPTAENIFENEYPLVEDLTLYLHPKAPPEAKEYCEFAIGREGAKIAKKWYLYPGYQRREYFASKRLKEMKAGKGTRLSAIGNEAGRTAVPDLALEYVRAKDVVQLSYAAVGSDVSSVGAFITGAQGRRELLLLADKPSGRALELHGEKWNALGPDGTGPAEYVLAGRAVAIIVNPTNKLESLTVGQIQAIFAGEVDDWAVIGGTELSAPGGPSGKSKDIPIHAFGLRPRRPATEIFEGECLPRRKWRGVKTKKDTAAAVAAVSMDPRAIAFVDLTAIPGIGPASLAGNFAAAGQNVKVLAIQMGIGERAKIIQPTPENIRNAMYPLSQRYFLYVHPKASETAKDFAKFIATCGGSEATPYADTVKAVMETYQKHGLIPLADAAIERVTKDAMAAAAAKAKAEAAKPKKRTGGRR